MKHYQNNKETIHPGLIEKMQNAKNLRAEQLASIGITSEEELELSLIHIFQAEGSFAQVKHDMNFKRFMCRGQKNVLAESILLAIAHNVNKLHNKIQYNRTGKHLFALKEA